MRTMILTILILGLTDAVFAQNQTHGCGAQPIPPAGCTVGRCIDGTWEQVCNSNQALMPCGIKPVPGLGCKIGECVDGKWEEICDSKSFISCGPQPIPAKNCTIGQCVNGSWQQICH